MDQRERINDVFEATKLFLDGRQTRIWTAIPGIIQSYNANAQTVEVQPSIKGRVTNLQNQTKWVNLPKLPDVPVMFPRGGAGGQTGQQQGGNASGQQSAPTIGGGSYQPANGISITFPIVAGDECLVVFAARCFDNWWQNGGIQPPAEARMHDLSDGFAILGFYSQPRKLTKIAQNTFQIRGDDGITLIELDPKNEVIYLRDDVNKNHIELDIKNQNVNIMSQKMATIQSQDGNDFLQFDWTNEKTTLQCNKSVVLTNKNQDTHITMDMTDQNINIETVKQITLQDQTGKNFLQFTFTNGTLVVQVATQIQFNCPKTVFSGNVYASDFITSSGGVTLGTHIHGGVTTGTGTTATGQG